MSHRAPSTWIEVDEKGIGWEVTVSHASHLTAYDRYDKTTKTQLPVVIENYCCPIAGCESRLFEPIYFNEDYGQRSLLPGLRPIEPSINHPFHVTRIVITGYRCPKCTIHFEDPVKFCFGTARIIAPVATERPQFPGIELTDEQREAFRKLNNRPPA